MCVMPMVDDKMPVPAWYVQTTSDESKANIVIDHDLLRVSTSCKGKDRLCVFQVLFYKNTVALKKGDEIIVFKEACHASKRKATAVFSNKEAASSKMARDE